MSSIRQFVSFAKARIGSGGRGSLALLFSGQGATGYNELRAIPEQLKDLLKQTYSQRQHTVVVEAGEDAAAACPAKEEHMAVMEGLDWMETVFNKHGESTMRDTRLVQPVQYTFSMAIAHALRQASVVDVAAKSPVLPLSVSLGHSLGEYSALTFSNALSFAQGKRLVEARGDLMSTALQEFSASREGEQPWSMVGLMRRKNVDGSSLGEDVAAIVMELKQTHTPGAAAFDASCKVATVNSPFQVTISGGADEVAEVVRVCRERRIISRSRALPVAAPFHCEIMRPAQDKFAEVLQQTTITPSLAEPVIANLSAEEYPADADQARALLSEQITGTVLWQDSILRAVQQHGVQAFLEITMGKPILSPLLEQSLPTAVTCCLSTPEDVMTFIEAAQAD